MLYLCCTDFSTIVVRVVKNPLFCILGIWLRGCGEIFISLQPLDDNQYFLSEYAKEMAMDAIYAEADAIIAEG